MKILIGVDESSCSSAALQFVRDMPLPASTQIVIVSAIPLAIPAYTEAYVPVSGGTIDRIMEDQAKLHEELAAGAERRFRDSGLETKARVMRGDPREAILDAAREEHADLIVVGSHGRSGIAKLVMGSVATHVVTHAPCSVLVVKAKGRPS